MAKSSYQKTGVLSESDLKRLKLLPSKDRFDKGPVVVVECIEKIPCNPCADACPKKAITIEKSIIEIPSVDFDTCNGCGLCIARCPGLAIFVINKNYNEKEASISLPYEFLPRPQKGETVLALDRQGKVVSNARVEKVLDTKIIDRWAVITIAVPKKYYNTVR
ncbi:MAG: 4Fe-4S binding protein, partial [candidate division WOR-3 bacterium]|nr:4Fe-4S binding protein [candidate division WOR-3 bacterium]